jgi:4-amino-4-deoxy-L-arabinose transferase-like glycosyltransferase
MLCRFGCSNGASLRGLSRAVSAAAILGLMPAYAGFSRMALHDIYLTASITTALTIVFCSASTAANRCGSRRSPAG